MQRFGCSVPLGPALDFGIGIFFLITSHTQWCDAGGEQTKLCHSSDLCSLSLDNCSWTPFSIHSAWSWSHVTNFCPVGVAAVSVLPSRPPAPSSHALSVVGYLDAEAPRKVLGRGAESHLCFHQALLLCHVNHRAGEGRGRPFILLRQQV